jgi:hypothetical protein
MWLRDLTGLAKDDPVSVRAAVVEDGAYLTSTANGRRMRAGVLTLPSLAALRAVAVVPRGANRLREVVGDVQALHADPANAGAVFQVASQFNLLEMPDPSVGPDDGIAGYEYDRTQGPACAIACGAGTIYRNYLMPMGKMRGQSWLAQVDCLANLGAALGNEGARLWDMKNGYALPKAAGLAEVCTKISALGVVERETLKGLLQIGVQEGTEVTLVGSRSGPSSGLSSGLSSGAGHLVTQAYCSALPIAYSGLPAAAWEPFARLVLEASYEACFRVAASVAPDRPLFLTLVGGGAFGNPKPWILDAIAQGLLAVRGAGLDVRLVSYGRTSLDPAWLEAVNA